MGGILPTDGLPPAKSWGNPWALGFGINGIRRRAVSRIHLARGGHGPGGQEFCHLPADGICDAVEAPDHLGGLIGLWEKTGGARYFATGSHFSMHLVLAALFKVSPFLVQADESLHS